MASTVSFLVSSLRFSIVDSLRNRFFGRKKHPETVLSPGAVKGGRKEASKALRRPKILANILNFDFTETPPPRIYSQEPTSGNSPPGIPASAPIFKRTGALLYTLGKGRRAAVRPCSSEAMRQYDSGTTLVPSLLIFEFVTSKKRQHL